MEQTLARGQAALPACHHTLSRALPAPHGRVRTSRQPHVCPSIRLANATRLCNMAQRRSYVAHAIAAPTVDRPAAASGTSTTHAFSQDGITSRRSLVVAPTIESRLVVRVLFTCTRFIALRNMNDVEVAGALLHDKQRGEYTTFAVQAMSRSTREAFRTSL